MNDFSKTSELLFSILFADDTTVIIKGQNYNNLKNLGKIKWVGIKMLDIQSHYIAIKTVWVKRILSSSAPWSIIGKDIITKFNKNGLLLYGNDPEINDFEKLPPFYKQVFQGLIKTNSI